MSDNVWDWSGNEVGDLLLELYGDSIEVVRDNNGFAYARYGDSDWFISSLPQIPTPTQFGAANPASEANSTPAQAANGATIQDGAVWYDLKWREIQAANRSWTDQQVTDEMTRRIEEANWNAEYQKLVYELANTSSVTERDELIKKYQAKLLAYKASGINVTNDLKHLGVVQGIGTNGIAPEYLLAPDNAALYEREPTEAEKADGVTRIYYGDGTSGLEYPSGAPAEGESEKRETRNKVMDSIRENIEEVQKLVMGEKYTFGDIMEAMPLVLPQVGPGIEVAHMLKGLRSISLFKGSSKTAEKVVGYFNPINKGPLPDAVANSFRSATYSQKVLGEDIILYRAYGGKAKEIGQYWTRTKPEGPLQTVIDSALDQSWGNTATRVAKIRIPKDTTIYEGFAEKQGGLVGGGNQVYIYLERIDPAWLIK